MRLRVSSRPRRLGDTRAEQVGFCRFLRNPRVSTEEILGEAARRTSELVAGRHVVLVEDTTEINYQAKAGRKRGLGRVGNGTDVGLFVHPALALDAEDGSVLGLGAATIWRRQKVKAAAYQRSPIESKESHRWLQTIEQAKPYLAEARQVTVVADREADIYELFARLPDGHTHLVVRAAHDRALDEDGRKGGRLFAALANAPEAACLTLVLPARPARPARTARLAIRYAALALRQPVIGADRRDARAVAVNAIEVIEIDPPPGASPILWRLLTSHPVTCGEEAIGIVDLYRCRWGIEQLFRTLKTQAIDLEDTLLADGEALEKLAATALVAATSVMQLVHARGQAGWALPASRVFSSHQIATLHALTPRLEGRTPKQKNKHPPSTLAWAAWHIARLGGWNGYDSERPPGPITFTHGLQRFEAIAEGFALALRFH